MLMARELSAAFLRYTVLLQVVVGRAAEGEEDLLRVFGIQSVQMIAPSLAGGHRRTQTCWASGGNSFVRCAVASFT